MNPQSAVVVVLAATIYMVSGQAGKDKYECMDRCMSEFVALLQLKDRLINDDLCVAYSELKTCMTDCPNGLKLLSGIGTIAPKSYKIVTTSCDPQKLNEPVDPSVLEGMQGEGIQVQEMEVCVKECESYLQKHMLMSTKDLAKACMDWEEYNTCIKNCPLGEKAWSVAKRTFPNMFDTIETACSEAPAVSPIRRPATNINTQVGLPRRPQLGTTNMLCVQDCSMKLMGLAKAPFSSQVQFCAKWTEGKACYKSCDGGEAFLAGISRMVPKSYKLLQEMCLDPTADSDVDPALLSDVLGEAREAKELEKCVAGCEEHVQGIISNIGNLKAICNSWFNYEQCVLRCPGGAEVMETAKNAFSQIFDVISSNCGEHEPVLAISSGSESESQEGVLASGPVGSPLRNVACIQECTKKMSGLGGPQIKSQIQFCDKWSSVKSCFRSCDGGDAFLAGIARIVPKSYKTIGEICQYPSDAEEIDPTLLKDILGEGDEAKKLEECVSGCEIHVAEIIHSAGDIGKICQSWSKYSQCVEACPGGKAAMDTAKSAFSDVFGMIEGVCGNKPSLPASISSDVDWTRGSVAVHPSGLTFTAPSKNFNCIESCNAKLQMIDRAEEKSEAIFCDEWTEIKECFATCKGGAAFLSGIAKTVPRSYQMVQEMCQNPSDARTVDTKLHATFQEESKGAAVMEVCVSSCNNHIIDHMGEMGNRDALCKVWFRYESCVLACPKGATLMEAAKKSFSDLYNIIRDTCGTRKLPEPDSPEEVGLKQKPSMVARQFDHQLPHPSSQIASTSEAKEPKNGSGFNSAPSFGKAITIAMAIIGFARFAL